MWSHRRGIKVLEIASWLATPSCPLMADMGAEVIKVETPVVILPQSYRDVGKGLCSPLLQFDNRGKQGICINLEDEAGREALRRWSNKPLFFLPISPAKLARYGLLAATFSNSRQRPFTRFFLAMVLMVRTAIAKLSIKRLLGKVWSHVCFRGSR